MTNLGESVTLVRTIKAPARAVFEAWTDPNTLRHLFHLSRVEVDARVGGRYRFETDIIRGLPGSHVLSGVYRVLQPGRRIVKSWVSEGSARVGKGVETLLTIDLRPVGPNVVELILHEEGSALACRGDREVALRKWSHSLNELVVLLSTGEAHHAAHRARVQHPGNLPH